MRRPTVKFRVAFTGRRAARGLAKDSGVARRKGADGPWNASRKGCAGILAPRIRVALGVMISSRMRHRCGSTG
jgi:hypothetical protein